VPGQALLLLVLLLAPQPQCTLLPRASLLLLPELASSLSLSLLLPGLLLLGLGLLLRLLLPAAEAGWKMPL
jgi:hypothetical protein